MKVSKSYLWIACLAALGLVLANLISLNGYFDAVEEGGGLLSEKRLLGQLQLLHDQLKKADLPEEASQRVKAFEAAVGHGADSDFSGKLRKTYAPVLAAFGSKPKESEPRYLMVKKRELMEGLVNAYRKEIPNGRIPVRAAYLNILFDLQNSLLNESDEAELVFLKRNLERFVALKGLVRAGDQGLVYRVSNLEGVFQSLERGFELSAAWHKEKADSLAKVERNLPKLAREIYGSKDEQAETLRRSFLYSCILSVVAAIAAFAAIYLGYKVLRLRAAGKTDSFLHLLSQFGGEREDAGYEKALRSLREDPEWTVLVDGMVTAEESFIARYQTLISVPKSLRCPYLVFTKDRVAKQWNREAAALFSLENGTEPALDELVREGTIWSSQGESQALVEMVRNSFSAPKADAFELMIGAEGTAVPYELLSFPVISGPLAGGKVYLFREIRNEAERINQRVVAQVARVRDIVHKITHYYPVEINRLDGDSEETWLTVSDLGTMKRKVDERESLWQSETQALLDQVSRQKEILESLAEEIGAIRVAQGKALEIVHAIHGGDDSWHTETCSLEQEVGRWREIRKRLEVDLARQETVLGRARLYEKSVRLSVEEVRGFLASYEGILAELRAFGEEAQLHATNMSFVKDPAYREFSSRCRAYARELERFIAHADRLAGTVSEFVASHPASTLAPVLDQPDLDPALLQGLAEEEARFTGFLARWRGEGRKLVTGAEQALALLRQADKKGAVASQLGETSLLINDQAKGNLERWN